MNSAPWQPARQTHTKERPQVIIALRVTSGLAPIMAVTVVPFALQMGLIIELCLIFMI